MENPGGTIPIIFPILLVTAGILVVAPFPAYAIWKLSASQPRWKRVLAFVGVIVFIIFWAFQAASGGWRQYPIRS